MEYEKAYEYLNKKCVSTIKQILYATIWQMCRVDRPYVARAVQQTAL